MVINNFYEPSYTMLLQGLVAQQCRLIPHHRLVLPILFVRLQTSNAQVSRSSIWFRTMQ